MWRSFFYNYGKMEITKNEGTQNTIPNQLFHNGVNQTWKSFTIHVGCLYQPISGTATMIHFLSKTRRMALQWESQVVSMPLGDSSWHMPLLATLDCCACGYSWLVGPGVVFKEYVELAKHGCRTNMELTFSFKKNWWHAKIEVHHHEDVQFVLKTS